VEERPNTDPSIGLPAEINGNRTTAAALASTFTLQTLVRASLLGVQRAAKRNALPAEEDEDISNEPRKDADEFLLAETGPDDLLLGVAQIFSRQEFRLRSLEGRFRRMEAANGADCPVQDDKLEGSHSSATPSQVPAAGELPTKSRERASSCPTESDRRSAATSLLSSSTISGEMIVIRETVRGLEVRLRQHEASMDLLNKSLSSVVSQAVCHEVQLRLARVEGRIAGLWETLYGEEVPDVTSPRYGLDVPQLGIDGCVELPQLDDSTGGTVVNQPVLRVPDLSDPNRTRSRTNCASINEAALDKHLEICGRGGTKELPGRGIVSRQGDGDDGRRGFHWSKTF
jgi:hypothetical protein